MNGNLLRALDAVAAERAGDALLSVRGLTVRFRLGGGRAVAAVSDADFDLAPGECLALVGESGCGKSVLASALLGLLPGNAETSGTAILADPPGGEGRTGAGADSGAGARRAADGGAARRVTGGAPLAGAGGRHATGADDRHASAGAPHAAADDGEPAGRPGRAGRGEKTGARGGTGFSTGAGGGQDAGGRRGARSTAETADGRAAGPRVGAESAVDLLAVGEETLARTVRGRRVGLVPQSPAAHLTPVRTVRAHLEETVRALTGTARRARRKAAEEAAERAAFPAGHLDRYPHELSGGLAQRAATALALVGDARLLLADEPTTGLDRELVDRTVDELRRHVDEGRGLLLITHDLAAAARIADRVAVMYAGRIVEIAPAHRFFGPTGPRHPYARGLLDALPERAFTPVPGMPPELSDLPPGCAFAPRCPRATDLCATTRPEPRAGVACHHPEQSRA
ncbi:ABC transporter ATP-binding protein [Streptomyces sp. NPDC020807]|uniref:ABC transporter ATP-binding protein n=1 Tax=Streptomyces sp. NPDC020807 TaxID=3155119 RepID=UPI003410E71E